VSFSPDRFNLPLHSLLRVEPSLSLSLSLSHSLQIANGNEDEILDLLWIISLAYHAKDRGMAAGMSRLRTTHHCSCLAARKTPVECWIQHVFPSHLVSLYFSLTQSLSALCHSVTVYLSLRNQLRPSSTSSPRFSGVSKRPALTKGLAMR
jgi:hypothetical protein